MATKDDILGVKPSGDVVTGEKLQEQPSEEEKSGLPIKSEESPTPQGVKRVETSSEHEVKHSSPSDGFYDELLKQLSPMKPKSEDEIKAEEKRQKRKKLMAAISDGIGALSNLYFTSKGAPNMFDGSKTASEKRRVNYERMVKDRSDNALAYANLLMRLRGQKNQEEDTERSWRRQLEIDDRAAQWRQEDKDYQKERDKKADDRSDRDFNYRKERDKKNDDYREKEFNEGKRQADQKIALGWANYKVSKQRANNAAVDKGGKPVSQIRGKQLGFSDGNGNQVAIYENVWKGSMQQVYDAMLEDLAPTDEKERKRWERQMKKHDTPQKKEDYVKQNWHKSKAASNLMLSLSKLDPVTMGSQLTYDEEDDYSQYEEGDEDYSQYEEK